MRKLYEVDSFCKEFTSKVLSCEASSRKDGSFFEIELEDTAFYPEGGGQPYDVGWLNQVEVLEVHEKNGKVLHLAQEEIPVGKVVDGKIDWKRRFQLMQQHSGEHILSGFAHGRFGCENVGFHMGKDFVTIDFDRVLTWEQVQELEALSNEYIWENHALEVTYPSAEELSSLAYRSKKELSGDVRIVRFPGADCCACCGTHVQRSGQVGLVKVFSCQKFREGVRIELLCGGRALAYLTETWEQNQKISSFLSAKPKESSQAVLRLQEEKEALEWKLQQVEKQQVAQRIEQYQGERYLFVEGMSLHSLRILATELGKRQEEPSAWVACFLQEGELFRYAFSSNTGDVRPVVKAINESFSGRGGGKANLAQGSVTASREALEAFLGQV